MYTISVGARIVFSHTPVRLTVFGLSLMLIGQAAPAPAQEAGAPDELNIVIIGGDNAINNIRQRTAREAIVQVEDRNHNRVPGAIVVFMLPGNGPGGTFVNGARMLTVTTDAQGRAVASGLHPNTLTGKFEIRVTASYQGKTGHAVIHQENVAPVAVARFRAKWIVIGAAVAGGLAGGLYAAFHSSSSSQGAASQSVSLSPIGGTVGAPH